MKTIEKHRQKQEEEEIQRQKRLDERMTKAINGMSTNTLIRLMKAMNNCDDESLSEKRRQSEWNKVETIFEKEFSKYET